MWQRAKKIYRSLPWVRRTASSFPGGGVQGPAVKPDPRFPGGSYGGWSVTMETLSRGLATLLEQMVPTGVWEYARKTYRSLPFVRRTASRFLGRRFQDPTVKLDSRFLGSAYGGRSVNLEALGPSSVVYSFGVGQDVSFDLELIGLVGCEINAFDPTPLSTEWIGRQNLPKEFKFHRLGVAATDGTIDFHYPEDESSVSFSLRPESASARLRTVECPVQTVSTIMRQLGHDRIDLAKFDIEGFEFEVISNLIQDKIRPLLLLIEFHHGVYGITKSMTRSSVQELLSYGYGIYWISDLGREYGFVDLESDFMKRRGE
jgi:FkbM family methyltransferase